MTVADEKDKLGPQLEEARWRNRQLEKDVQQLQDTSNATEQVSVSLQFHCAWIIAVSLCLSPSKAIASMFLGLWLKQSMHCDITWSGWLKALGVSGAAPVHAALVCAGNSHTWWWGWSSNYCTW